MTNQYVGVLASDRFWAKVNKTETCWLWNGGKSSNGYGVFWFASRLVPAHCWSYENYVGPIPQGWEVDHVAKWGCTSKACVRPSHLEAVTKNENGKRGCAYACRKGHVRTSENTGRDRNGYRLCLICQAEFRDQKNRKRRAARAALTTQPDPYGRSADA